MHFELNLRYLPAMGMLVAYVGPRLQALLPLRFGSILTRPILLTYLGNHFILHIGPFVSPPPNAI